MVVCECRLSDQLVGKKACGVCVVFLHEPLPGKYYRDKKEANGSCRRGLNTMTLVVIRRRMIELCNPLVL
jgi:hypothetical protein